MKSERTSHHTYYERSYRCDHSHTAQEINPPPSHFMLLYVKVLKKYDENH